MGIGVSIHGSISISGFPNQKESKEVYKHNKSVIGSLPRVDDDWPFLTKSMFSVLPLRNNYDISIPQYDYLLISFCASYKNMYVLDSEWVAKFEALLARLCWDEAVVYNEFSSMKYVWEVPSVKATENYFADPAVPPKIWTLNCFKIGLEQIQLNDAISGRYSPYFDGKIS